MSRMFDALQKSDGQLGEMGRRLVRQMPNEPVADDDEHLSSAGTGTDALDVSAAVAPADSPQHPLVVRQQPQVVTDTPELDVPERRTRSRRFPAFAATVLLCLGGYGAWRVYTGQSLVPSWPSAQASGHEMRFTGVVVAQETAVSAKIPGRIERLLVDEGSIVKAGDLIATLDRQETAAERDNQQARVDQLNARVLQTQEMLQLEQERNNHQLQRALAQSKAVESELRTAEVELEQSRKDLARGHDLRQAGVIPARDIERYQMTVEVNESRVRSLQERVQASTAEVELMRSNVRQVAVAASDVDQTRAQLVQAEALRQQAQVRLDYSTVRAPLSGTVSVRVARQGEVVTAGAPIVTLVDLSDIWVKADVEETWISRFHLGSRLPVQLASGERTTGEVFFISPEGEFATQRDINRVKRDVRTFGIKLRLANESRRIHPGMTAYVLLPNPSATDQQ